MRQYTAVFCLSFVAVCPSNLPAAEKLKLLIIDGQNNHDWKAMTPIMKKDFEQSGRFSVEVATTPPRGAAKEQWSDFRPEFTRYDAVVSNYNGEPWPDEVNAKLVEYVRGGGGLVIIHAANNAFSGWPEWNEMIGLGWRGLEFGRRLTLDDAGKEVITAPGSGPGAGHGPQHAYAIVVRDTEHPVTAGMPREWLHAQDELYHGQRGPAQNMQVLATAYSSKAKGGTGAHEPMIWIIPYGQGRVFTTVMGHVNGGQTVAIRCKGFKAVMLRGSEWAATGKVTLPIPKDFPTADQTSIDGE